MQDVPSNISSDTLVSVQVKDPYNNADSTLAWKTFANLSELRADQALEVKKPGAKNKQKTSRKMIWSNNTFVRVMHICLIFLYSPFPHHNHKPRHTPMLKSRQESWFKSIGFSWKILSKIMLYCDFHYDGSMTAKAESKVRLKKVTV